MVTMDLTTSSNGTNSSALLTTIGTVSAAARESSPGLEAFIVRWSVSLALVLCGVVGNGITLAAVGTMPNMATKTNKILGNLAITGLLFLTVNTITVFTYNFIVNVVIGKPCDFTALDTVFQGIQRMPPRISYNHLIVMGIDRYIAVIHPHFYEERFTDTVVNRMLAASWTCGILMALLYSLWAVNANLIPCRVFPDVIPSVFTLEFDTGHYLVTAVFLVIVYAKIMPIAMSHRIQVADEGVDLSSVPESVSPDPASASASTLAPVALDSGDRSNETNSRRHTTKQRTRQFKTVILTASVAGFFIVMWFTYALSGLLVLVGVSSASGKLNDVGSGLGLFNFTFTWVIFGLVSNSYRKAYKNLYKRWCRGPSTLHLSY